MILVLDHYDSFVYNLVQLIEGFGETACVIRSDAAPVADLLAMRPDGVVLSPGPGRPEQAGNMVQLVRALDERTPVLGVCLGHQAIGVAFGARVIRAPEPVHGKPWPIRHGAAGVLAGLTSPLEGGRYHSLVVARDGLPSELEVTAETPEGLVMGVAHTRRPVFGVQFHPESILTPEGPRIVEAFLGLVARAQARGAVPA